MTMLRTPFIVFLLVSLAACAPAAELILPAPALERDRLVTVIFRTRLQSTGTAQLHITWTDSYGRDVEDRTTAVKLTDESEMRFTLNLTRALAMQNEMRVHFIFDGVNKKGEKEHRDEEASVGFIARPPADNWWDYKIIMWQDGDKQHFAQLKQVGVNAGKSAEHAMTIPDSLLSNNLQWYVENMATDFYSAYHIYRPDRPYNYAFLNAKAEYKANPDGKDGLKRYPSFEDPHWTAKIHDRLVEYARTYSPYKPLFYNLADESGIAELAAFWDFDFSDHSLAAMRTWLADRYGTLNNLNKQWETNFSVWQDVTPDTTRAAMKRTDDNFSSWADFKEWMDLSFENALKRGVDAIHSVDPAALVGIEGAQMPGWGGYDYYRLSNVLQAMEPYDIGSNVEIIRSFNPKLAFVTTAFAQGPWEKQRLWYELLHGARGHIVWDEKSDIVNADGTLGPRGKDVEPNWLELRNGIGALLINSVRQSDPIAIHYSQASMRTEWMLKQRVRGDSWMDRMSWTERQDSDFLALRNSYCHLIEDTGRQYNFVAYGQIEKGELLRGGYRILILPHSNSLSQAEALAIKAFVRQGGVLVVDGEAGTFDDHSRKLPQSSLQDLLEGSNGQGTVVRFNALKYAQQRILGMETELHTAMLAILKGAQLEPAFAVTDSLGKPVVGLETHEFLNGGLTIIGVLSNPQMQIDDLGAPNAAGNLKSQPRFEKTQTIRLAAPGKMYAYDLRQGKALGLAGEVTATIGPYEPLLIAFSPTAIPPLRISAPARIARGETATLGISLTGHSAAAVHIFHVEVRDPSGKFIDYFSGNLKAINGVAAETLPIALNDTSGQWTIQVTDTLSGQRKSAALEVF